MLKMKRLFFISASGNVSQTYSTYSSMSGFKKYKTGASDPIRGNLGTNLKIWMQISLPQWVLGCNFCYRGMQNPD